MWTTEILIEFPILASANILDTWGGGREKKKETLYKLRYFISCKLPTIDIKVST